MNRIQSSRLLNQQAGQPQPMSAAQPHRQSMVVQGGKSLMDALPKNSQTPAQQQNQGSQLNSNRSNILRASANSQINGPRPKYAYHQPKPATLGEKVGEYVTKEARIEKAQEIKSAHFKLAWSNQSKTLDARAALEEENIKQKWNPKSIIAKTDLASSNWQLGRDQHFDGLSQNKKDFPDHGAHYDPHQKAKRIELANQLRRSNLPAQHFDFPKSTAQESYAGGKSKADEMQAIKDRKAEADKVFARVRGVKPNFTLGNHKVDYLSENKGSLKQHADIEAVSKSKLAEQAAQNRQHNYKMSFEQGDQFKPDKGVNQPYKLPASQAYADRYTKKGASNIHQVQIGDTRVKSDYQSLTAMQQNGHKESNSDPKGAKTNASYSDVRQKIAEQTKDLRASHFALGVNNQVNQASSKAMFAAPPTNALVNGTNEMREARERIQRSNFTIKDAHGIGNGTTTTTSQANNMIRQTQMANGQVVSAQAVPKPADSINFGQSREYVSTFKDAFVGMNQDARKQKEDQIRFKNKFLTPNINLGRQSSNEAMMTVAQANDQNVVRQNQGNQVNQDLASQKKENAGRMRVTNIKMGSILPEHNGYKVLQLDSNRGNGSTRNQAQFQSLVKPDKKPLNAQTVSAGNNVAKGQGTFRTINQDLTNWIQPSAVAK